MMLFVEWVLGDKSVPPGQLRQQEGLAQQHQGLRLGLERQGPARRTQGVQDQAAHLLRDPESPEADLHRRRVKVPLRCDPGRTCYREPIVFCSPYKEILEKNL